MSSLIVDDESSSCKRSPPWRWERSRRAETGQTGSECHDRGAKILFTSGYSDISLEAEARKSFPFIRKPFLASDSVCKVREVLGASEPPSAKSSKVS